MSMRVILTGMLPFLVVAAAVLAIPVSWLLLRLYRRSVRRGMIVGGPPAGSDRVVGSSPTSALHIESLSDAPVRFTVQNTSPEFRTAAGARWRTTAVYAAAGASFAVVMTAGFFFSDRTQNVVFTKTALVFWSYFWPVVPAAFLVAAYDRRRRLHVLGAYCLVLLAIFVVALIRNPGLGVSQLLVYCILTNGPPTVLVMAFLYRPVRAVGPLVLAFLIAMAMGSQVLLSIADRNTNFLKTVVHAGVLIGLGGTASFVALIVIGMLLFGLLVGWPLLRLLGLRYGRKKLSDQSLTLDAVWLVFALVYSIDLVFNGAPWILTGLIAFLAYKLACMLGFRWLASSREPGRPKTMLLLRVFALGKRSEELFDKLRKHWQYVGGICMIAGPDLATSTVEPHEFLDFLRGRMGRQFVANAEDLERRLSALDRVPDPDGRFRITEFFCHNDTWQMTMEQLAASSDVILMDLRSFSPNSRGCTFELGRLLDRIDLARVVFLVDSTTDLKFLESTVLDLWKNLATDSPNRLQAACSARLFPVGAQRERELNALLSVLLPAA